MDTRGTSDADIRCSKSSVFPFHRLVGDGIADHWRSRYAPEIADMDKHIHTTAHFDARTIEPGCWIKRHAIRRDRLTSIAAVAPQIRRSFQLIW